MLLLACAVAVAGCGNGSGTPRPTDPRQILVEAIAATAGLPTLRLHAEIASTTGGVGAQANAVVTLAVDADIDLATRQLVGRATTQMPRNPGGNGGLPAQQVADAIVTRDAIFGRDSQTGRWRKISSTGIGGGPTNAQVATMLSNLLSNPSITFDRGDASPCSLGTCDHVVAHIDGQSLGAALGPLLGVPMDAAATAAIPDFDVDVLVDQATSVISELRTAISTGGSAVRIFVSVSNPGQPVQIAPPPPALTDDFGGLGGGFGPQATTILGTVGGEIETPTPLESDASSAP
ncbi:MAG TPA: hypothetical protein VK194_04740 [Candidatus Deferrimicrobium sp.]|nr:hypothetical protein [Candidatus Deferrimicrobium sp.]